MDNYYKYLKYKYKYIEFVNNQLGGFYNEILKILNGVKCQNVEECSKYIKDIEYIKKTLDNKKKKLLDEKKKIENLMSVNKKKLDTENKKMIKYFNDYIKLKAKAKNITKTKELISNSIRILEKIIDDIKKNDSIKNNNQLTKLIKEIEQQIIKIKKKLNLIKTSSLEPPKKTLLLEPSLEPSLELKRIGLDFDGVFHKNVYYEKILDIEKGQGHPNKYVHPYHRFNYILDDQNIMNNDIYIISANYRKFITDSLKQLYPVKKFDESKIISGIFDKYDKIVELELDEFYDDSLNTIIKILKKEKSDKKLKKGFKLFWVLPLGLKPYRDDLYLPNINIDDKPFKVEIPLIEFSDNDQETAKQIVLLGLKQYEQTVFVYSWNIFFKSTDSKLKEMETKLKDFLPFVDIFAFQECPNTDFGNEIFSNFEIPQLKQDKFVISYDGETKKIIYPSDNSSNPKFYKFYTDHSNVSMITYVNYNEWKAEWIQAGVILHDYDNPANIYPYHAILLTNRKTGKKFILINRHMPHKNDNKKSNFQKLLDELKTKLLDELETKEDIDIIVVGDFNDEEDKLYKSKFNFNEDILKSDNDPPLTCCGNREFGIIETSSLISCDYAISNKKTINMYPFYNKETYFNLSDHFPIIGVVFY